MQDLSLYEQGLKDKLVIVREHAKSIARLFDSTAQKLSNFIQFMRSQRFTRKEVDLCTKVFGAQIKASLGLSFCV
jgi:hypothetical protein